MTKKISIAFIAISLVIAFFACNKNDSTTKNSDSNKSKSEVLLKNLDNQYLSERMFTDSEIDSLGKLHNSLLTNCYNAFNFETTDYSSEFLNQFNTHGSQYSLNSTNLDLRTNVDSMISVLENNLSSTAFDFVIRIKNEADNIQNVNAFKSKISQIEIEIKNTTIGKETDILLSICSIIKESAYYWLPIDMGGSGIGYEVVQEFYPDLAERGKNSTLGDDNQKNWGKIIGYALVSDGFSGGVGMLGVAVAGILGGPIGWGALIIVFGESVLSSGFSVFLDLVRK